ncbi:MAG: hypothetical protein AAF226_18700, partial [Verrucomicrobiota bacterium]
LNTMLNGMLGLLLGSRLSFIQTSLSLLRSFALFGLIVGSLSPLTLGMALDMPGPESPDAAKVHSRLLILHVAIIALSGVLATLHLYRLLRHRCPSKSSSRLTMLGWLAGNLFLGAQVSYILRPIFGQPHLEVQFLRPDPFNGNFYESLWWAITRL